jgi:hypothetical protein
MDDQTLNQSLKQTLTDRAQSAIPDDYDNWAQIQDALSKEQDPMKLQSLRVAPTNPRRVRRLIFVIAAALLLTTTAVYAVYQVFPPPITDQGVEGIQREGYTTELNLVQRIGDVEVQLNWGYIDTSRVVLDYQIFGINPDGTRTTDHHYALYKALLKNKDAVLEERSPSTDSAGNVQPGIPGKGTLTYEYPRRFDPGMMPDMMNFQLEVLVAEGKLSVLRSMDYVLRSFIPFSIWRSATTEHLYEWPERLYRPESTAEPGVDASGPMLFDFALPVERAVVIEPQQTVEENGVVGRIERISVSPSRTIVNVCFKVPSTANELWPEASVFVDDVWVRSSSGAGFPPDAEGFQCHTFNFDVFIEPGTSVDVRVDITIAASPDAEPMLELQQYLAEQGIEIEVSPDGNGYSWRTGDESKIREGWIELGYIKPWEFTVEIPEQ